MYCIVFQYCICCPSVRCCCSCCCCGLPPFCSCSAAYCCCSATIAAIATIAAAAVGSQAAPFSCGLHQLLCCQGLLLADPILLQLLLLMLILMLGRTIVCVTVLPSPRLELTTTPLALANQQLSVLGRTCFTRPTQDRVAASLSIVRTLICSSDEDLWQTGRIHPDFPCPPISVLQPPPLTRANLYFYERHL